MDEDMTLRELLERRIPILFLEVEKEVLYGFWEESFGGFTFRSQMCDISRVVDIPVENKVSLTGNVAEIEDRLGRKVRIILDS